MNFRPRGEQVVGFVPLVEMFWVEFSIKLTCFSVTV